VERITFVDWRILHQSFVRLWQVNMHSYDFIYNFGSNFVIFQCIFKKYQMNFFDWCWYTIFNIYNYNYFWTILLQYSNDLIFE
jgi:hypothetical protein